MEDEAKIDDEDRTRCARWCTVTGGKEEVNKRRNQNRVQKSNEGQRARWTISFEKGEACAQEGDICPDIWVVI